MDVKTRIKELALEAHGYIVVGGGTVGHMEIAMAKLADEVAYAEREACAKVADEFSMHPDTASAAPVIASAIRSRAD